MLVRRPLAIVPGGTSGALRQLNQRDRRAYNLPVVAVVYCCMLLLLLAVRRGIMHLAFWLAVVCCIAVILAAELYVRRFVDVWADDDGLILVRGSQLEKISWRDIAEVRQHWSPECAVRFRRETHFGRAFSFRLRPADRLIGYDHPDALWMRQRIAGLHETR